MQRANLERATKECKFYAEVTGGSCSSQQYTLLCKPCLKIILTNMHMALYVCTFLQLGKHGERETMWETVQQSILRTKEGTVRAVGL